MCTSKLYLIGLYAILVITIFISMIKKTILITGATSGIGREIAKTLLGTTTLILIGRNKSKLMALQAEFQKSGSQSLAFVMDLSSTRSINAVSKKIQKTIPRIDWIINNAGTIEDGKKKTLDYGYKTIEKILHVNTIGPYLLIQKLQKPLLKGKGGVLNISSTAGLHGNPRFPIYSASKAALINLTEALAKSDTFLSKSIKAINIIPGATNTPMRQRIAKDAKTKQSPKMIAQWILDMIMTDKIPESGSSILFIDGKITERKLS